MDSFQQSSEMFDEKDNEEELRNELADIPLGELQKLKETVGLKKYSKAVFGSWKPQTYDNWRTLPKKNIEGEKVEQNKSGSQEQKSKSEPISMSSKIKNFRVRKVITNIKRAKRDPRFDDLSGKLNEELFEKSYGFVEVMKKEEMQSVKKQLKKVRNKEKKADLHKLLQRMEQKDQETLNLKKRKEKDRERKKSELRLAKEGKKPYYLKKSEKKKLDLAEKYCELRKNGQLNKYLTNKRKRNAAKEKKKLPNR
ncbi:ribosomal RNA processing protein 36 homolog [Hydractinia symbiolongicarpus]|uniref:ribosomal RNA processing protein 36 homolog n=1 Tax=Hydractinia symbiolongicarpus TaxID=13093 RepID=UPI002551BCB5|nr:ribosomal RNA processing protein 36 homolog [Hydractinia symbiolongicarpus]